jgi:signal transduction histidine kinase/chemotaxis response regulator CheB/SAM-dependent methyltransferase
MRFLRETHGSEITGMTMSPAAVAVLHVARSAGTLAALLAELDPTVVSAVLSVDAQAVPNEVALLDVIARAGFKLKPCTDGALLEPGCLYVMPARARVWFDGPRLRVGSPSLPDHSPIDCMLESLARVWGRRSVVLAGDLLRGDGEHGLAAVHRAGGAVFAQQVSSTSAGGGQASPAAALASSEAPLSRRALRSPRGVAPSFRVSRLFPFSSSVLDQLRAAAQLAARRASARDRVRVWVPGCRTGGLVYAMAMLVHEAIANAGLSQHALVFGTDDDEEALAVARAGRYPARAGLGMDPRLRGEYTLDEGETLRMAESLRQACVFSSHKLTRNAPFSRMDLIVCHRVFDRLPRLHRPSVINELCFALRADGILVALDHRDQFQHACLELLPEGYMRRRRVSGTLQSRRQLRSPVAPSSGTSLGDVSPTLPVLPAHTVALELQLQQQSALVRLGELALAATGQEDLFGEALSLLMSHVPACAAGLIVESTGARREVSVAAARGLGSDPLQALQSLGEPIHLLQDELGGAGRRPRALAESQGWIAPGGAARRFATRHLARASSPALAPLQARIAWPISSQGAELGLIALYTRQDGSDGVEHLPFLRAMAQLLGEAIAQQRIRRRLTLELDVSNVVASTSDFTELGVGLTRALHVALGADDLEIWTASSAPSPRWRREYPRENLHSEPASVPDGLLERGTWAFRAARHAGERSELWLPVRGPHASALVHAAGAALRAPDDELARGLEGCALTLAAFLERLQAIHATRQSASFYRHAHAELEALYAALPAGVSVHDDTGAVRSVNRHLSELDRRPHSGEPSLLQRLFCQLSPWITRVLATGEPIEGLEVQLEEAGEQRSWSCNIAAIRDTRAAISGAAAVMHDTTAHQRAEARWREVDRQKDEFLALLGHELRNPIAAIRNATELLGRIETPARQLPRLQKILERQGLQTTKLVDGLLDVARVTHGKLELEKAPLPLVEVVRQAVEDRLSELNERRLELHLPDDEVWVQADRTKLVQVIDNLLSNALKFTHRGGVVSVTMESSDGRGSICVEDDGIGIEAELLPSIFDPFRQGSALVPHAQRGLGLGLALVKALVELHGFHVSAHSEGAGRGAQFRIEFSTTPHPVRARPESYIDMRRLRLLVVEDNADIRDTLAELLESAGHEVESIGSAEAALAILSRRLPDVVLCDIGLPGMDGLELAGLVRSRPEWSALKLVAMTGYADANSRLRIQKAGFDRHLSKPVELDALWGCLATLSSVAAAQRQRC